jgi:hypothetical protein
VVLFWLSMDAYMSISIFCTVSASSHLGLLFSLLHLLFIGLIVLGILSFPLSRLRLPYIALLAAALAMLPVQGELVSDGIISCDAP